MLLALLLAGCIPTEPEFTEDQQVPQDDREQAGDNENGEDGEDAVVLRFVGVDIDYSEAPERAPAGDLTIELVNEGALVHNVVFEGVQGDQPVVEVEGGATAQGEVTLDAGTAVYYCSVPGHREAGMEGVLEVE
jgi:plastocyanin